MACGVLVHQALISAGCIVEVDLVVSAALRNDVVDGRHDRAVESPYVAALEVGQQALWMQSGPKQDVLGNRIPQTGNELDVYKRQDPNATGGWEMNASRGRR